MVSDRAHEGGHEMKKLLAAVSALLFFSQAGSVLASCRPIIEDAELKKMSSEKLAQTYCIYQHNASIHHNSAMRSIKPFREAARQGRPTASFEKAVVEHMANADECWEQAERIKSALENRSVSADLSCKSQ